MHIIFLEILAVYLLSHLCVISTQLILIHVSTCKLLVTLHF